MVIDSPIPAPFGLLVGPGGGVHNYCLWLPLLGDLSGVLGPAWGAFFLMPGGADFPWVMSFHDVSSQVYLIDLFFVAFCANSSLMLRGADFVYYQMAPAG